MHDLLISNGTIIDGSGDEPYTGDVAIRQGRIAGVGTPGSQGDDAAEVIDATGLVVTPGFVDIHSHYDGQVTWDPYLTPSCWHGVTTVVMGNCGVGFAPVYEDKRRWLVELMEGVEDIPGAALTAGMQWGWETFPEYLDYIAALPHVMDVGAQIAHGPLRAYVMGERGARNEPATAEDIAHMAAIVKDAIAAGALGFTTSRTMLHKALDGTPVPGTFANEDELFGIGQALAELDAGLYEVSPSGIASENDTAFPEEVAWMRRLAKSINRPVTFGMTQSNGAPRMYRDVLAEAAAAAAEGATVVPQVAGRASGLLFGLDTTYHPFQGRATYAAMAHLPASEKLARLRDPAVRAAILSEVDERGGYSLLERMAERIWPFTDDVDYEPPLDEGVGHIAAQTGRSPAEVLYEMIVARDPDALFMIPVNNYADNTFDAIREMIVHPNAVLGLADGGAHCAIICDASIPTTMITHWTRDRTRGEKLPLPFVIKRQTRDTAALYGLRDRGLLAPGYKADVNVIDYAGLRLRKPEMAYDLPGGAKRLVQRADGYVATIVHGEVVLRDGEVTGSLPGRVLRGAQPDPA
ncbi:MAG TPA: amidohydrolase family protein [Acidimicrobiales bacterium]|jgi:N-acyl-D-aspartate/D-glutamate deacylase|nr:amidohydrolase family protein [Acidimicrobiales bacterium]